MEHIKNPVQPYSRCITIQNKVKNGTFTFVDNRSFPVIQDKRPESIHKKSLEANRNSSVMVIQRVLT